MSGQSLSPSASVHWKHFNQYFADAACFALDAHKLESKSRNDQETQKRFTRSSVISSALALESAANCCLDVMRLDKATMAEYEKLQTLGKFDVFLSHVRPRKHLDREHKLVRPVRNLISCRNEYVHSKVMLEKVTNGQVEAAFWMPLGLPHNPAFWHPLHAIKTFTVLSDFLNYFFFEAVGYPYEGTQGRGITASILSSAVAAIEGHKLQDGVEFASVRAEEIFVTHDAAREWDLEFAFLGGYTTSGPDNKQIYPKRKWGDYSHCNVEELTIPWRPIWYNVPTGIGIIMVGNQKKQKHRK